MRIILEGSIKELSEFLQGNPTIDPVRIKFGGSLQELGKILNSDFPTKHDTEPEAPEK